MDDILKLLCVDPGERQSKESAQETTIEWAWRTLWGWGVRMDLEEALPGLAEALDWRTKVDKAKRTRKVRNNEVKFTRRAT